MAGSPRVPQGLINRLKGSLIIPDYPALNITAAFMGKQACSASFRGPATTRLPTMTGGVNSPEPYREVTITAHIVKSTALANAWKMQEERNALLGQVIFRADTRTLSPYQFDNCSLDGVNGLENNGMNPDFIVTIGGFYYINSEIWDG